MDSRYDGLQKIIDEALSAMAAEAGPGFLPEKANLAEFCRRTGLTRSKARTLRKKGFQAGPHGNAGRKAETTVLTGYTGVVDDQLRKGVTNSQAIFDRLKGQGYAGGITSVKDYIAAHRSLAPAPRRQAEAQGRLRRGDGRRAEPVGHGLLSDAD